MTIEIPLTKGQVALIDDEDAPLVAGLCWFAERVRNTFYARHFLPFRDDGSRGTLQMHRVIMAAQPGQLVDHRDRNGLNNTRANLRFCTRAENAYNRFQAARNKTGYKGVSVDSKTGLYYAQIRTQGRSYNLGFHADPIEAARAYDAAARKLFGEFAYLNFRD